MDSLIDALRLTVATLAAARRRHPPHSGPPRNPASPRDHAWYAPDRKSESREAHRFEAIGGPVRRASHGGVALAGSKTRGRDDRHVVNAAGSKVTAAPQGPATVRYS
jgi:hypothetical protein